MQLIGKSIVITGATSGIGLELLDRLVRHNRVYVIARDEEKIQSLTRRYPSVEVFQADLSQLDQVNTVAEQLLQAVDSLDVLVNNAAVQHTPTLLDADFKLDSIEQEITLNFTSVCQLTYLLLPRLMTSPNAAIVNVNSGLGLEPKTSSAIYCASKGALNIFTKSLRHQLQGTSVEVYQSFLPLVDTFMTKGRGDGKLTAQQAAAAMIKGVESCRYDHDIGKVKLLRLLIRFCPPLARSIMKSH